MYFQLSPEHDFNNALIRQGDLLRALRTHCPSYIQNEFVLDGANDLLVNLRSIPDQSVAHLLFLSHGSRMSLVVGAESISVDTPEFHEFVVELRRIMVPDSTIILTACHVGHIDPHCRDVPNRMVEYTNNPSGSFGPSLSRAIESNIRVICTPDYQVSDQLSLTWQGEPVENRCGSEMVLTSPRDCVYSYRSDGTYIQNREEVQA